MYRKSLSFAQNNGAHTELYLVINTFVIFAATRKRGRTTSDPQGSPRSRREGGKNCTNLSVSVYVPKLIWITYLMYISCFVIDGVAIF